MAFLILFFAMLFQGAAVTPSADKPEYLIRHYNVDDGLPVNAINGIVQDADGYLYFSTYDGLLRYDGYEFDVYNSGNTQEIFTNRLAGILEATDGTLWLFNEEGSITSKKGSLFKTYAKRDLPGQVTRLVEDHDGQVWVGGMNGLSRFSREDSAFKRFEHPFIQSKVNVLVTGTKSELYVVTNDGIYSIKNDTLSVVLTKDEFTIPVQDIRDIQLIGSDVLWVIGIKGAFLYNIPERKIEQTVKRKVSEITLASAWNRKKVRQILTTDSGFYMLGVEDQPYKKLEIPFIPAEVRLSIYLEGKNGEDILIGDDKVIIDNQIVLDGPLVKYAMVDNEGSLWIGSGAKGMYQIRKSSFTNISDLEIPGFKNIYSIIEDKEGVIWACSFTTGIYRLAENGYENWNSSNSALKNDLCKFIFNDEDGSIYASTNEEGLWKFKEGMWTRLNELDTLTGSYSKSVEALHRKGDQLLVSSFNSLIIHENNEFRFFDETRPRELSGVQVFRENSLGIIFVGTEGNGISRIEGSSFKNYSTENGVLNSNTIRDILLQSDDTLWVVNESVGLNRVIVDAEGSVLSSSSVTVKDGLTQNSLHRIIDDGLGFFWISGNNGIMRISEKELNAYASGESSELRVLSFNEKDGIINREANGGVQSAGIRASDGKLRFPTQRGITIINPSDFSVDYGLVVPPPVFESIELNNRDLFVDGAEEIIIPGHQRDLRIHFTVPNFVNQDRLIFTYLLEGVNERWQNATQSRQAVFTGVPPGRHQLIIRSQFIGDAPVESSLTIVIPSYFYETRWFWICMFLGMIGLIYTAFRIRLRSLKETERKLQLRVDAQTVALKKAAEQKQRFFTGITHELKTPLSLIIGPLNDLMEEPEKKADKKLSDRLSMMQRNSYRLKNLVDQILDVSKLNADAVKLKIQPVDLPQLTRQIIGQFQSKLEQEEISVKISVTGFGEYIYVDKEAWERIIINLMSNAIKFSPKEGTISLSFVEKKATVEVRIKDQGHGIKPEHHQKVFEYLFQAEGAKASEGTGIGLFLVKGLLEHMGGSITLRSDVGEGTEFLLTLQKGHSHIEGSHTLLHEPLISDGKVPVATVETGEESSKVKHKAFEHRILVVEDNDDFRTYLQSILEEQYEILLAENGKKALKILEKETPDLIISDIMMPEMNGLEFVNSIRSKKHFKHLPVIFLSAKNEDQDVQTGLSTGADVYLTKPIRRAILLTQIVAILRRERILQKGFSALANEPEPEFLQQVREIIFRQLGNTSLNVNQLADALYMSRGKLYAEWKKVSELSVNDFLKKTRLTEAKILLIEKGFTVQEAARAVGFSDANYFSTSFKKEFGVSPSEVK